MHEGDDGVEFLRGKVESGHPRRWNAVQNDVMQLFERAHANTAIAGQAGSAIGTVRIGTVAPGAGLGENLLAIGDLRGGLAQ